MKVKCIDVKNRNEEGAPNEAIWLTLDKEYVVLEVYIETTRNLEYRLVADNESEMPAIYAASRFEIISDLVPFNWCTTILKGDLIVLGPKNWRENQFWVSCYDHDPDALEIYRREVNIIYEEEMDFE